MFILTKTSDVYLKVLRINENNFVTFIDKQEFTFRNINRQMNSLPTIIIVHVHINLTSVSLNRLYTNMKHVML